MFVTAAATTNTTGYGYMNGYSHTNADRLSGIVYLSGTMVTFGCLQNRNCYSVCPWDIFRISD